MNQSNSNNGNQNVIVIFLVLLVLVGIWIRNLIISMAAEIGVEPFSVVMLLLGLAILLGGVCAAAMLDWGWKGIVRLSAGCTVFLLPAFHDWAVVHPFSLGAPFGQYEEVTRAWWGHGLSLFFGYIVILVLAWFFTKDD